MNIIKRNGQKQGFSPNKVYNRIKQQSKNLTVDVDKIFKSVIPNINDGMSTTEIDEILAFNIADFIQEHPDYSTLASRILITRQGKIINKTPEEVDLNYDFFATVTFLKKYSLKNDKEQPIELPSCMYNRVSEYFGSDKEIEIFKEEFKNKTISAATPILTNGGSSRNGYISCNLTELIDDSLEGIEETLTNIAKASKEGSGIGLLCDSLRSEESLVSTFKGNAGGVVRFADMVQSKMRFYKQGTRSGSAALYLSVWHKDILRFLELRLPVGDEKLRTRDLFTAVIINDNFMDCLLNEKDWYLFCPNDIKKVGLSPLQNSWGEEYENIYNKAVELGIGKKVNPKTIWDALIRSQVESGTPYTFYKDNANRKNMQNNIGVIKQSNLCIEICEVSKPNYTPQCTLGLIPLAYHDNLDTIDKSTRVLVRLLNKVIDKNQWSDRASKNAGEDQRALAIGIGGLADFFAKKKISFTSLEAKQWNKDIVETIYKAALSESNKLAEELNQTYPAWEDSLYSKGKTLIDNWSPIEKDKPIKLMNSLFVGLMPSASTSILLSINEAFEPFSSNLQVRDTGAGEFLIINKWLVKDLEEANLWNKNIQQELVQQGGSVQNLLIPNEIKERYRTIWEIPQRELINMAADRQEFIDQSQSLNLYFSGGEYGKISGALKYGWEKGLKTGSYYMRTEKKTEKPSYLATKVEKPANSPFECFGCSA